MSIPLVQGAAVPRPRRSFSRLSVDTRVAIILVAGAVVLLAVWEAVARLGLINKLFVSSPSDVFLALGALAAEPQVWTGLATTGLGILAAFVIGTAAGLVVGLLIGLSLLIRQAFYPVILFMLSMPKSVFLPIFLLLFGLGPGMAIAFGAFEAFFYVCVNVVGGVATVEARHLRVVTAFKGNLWYRIKDVILPAASPGIFTALWFGFKHAFQGVVIAELFSSAVGLGFLIHQYSNSLATDKTLALIGIVTIVAVLVGSQWNRLEKWANRWRPTPTSDN